MQLSELWSKSIRYAHDKVYRFQVNAARGLYNNMPDEEFLCMLFRLKMGYDLDLEKPTTFNEKLQWLKLHDRRPEYTMMVDKFAVKDYVAEKIGAQYIIPTLGVWNNFDEIDFNKLPDQFVLKCTHDSGGIFICKSKESFDKKNAKRKLEKHLERNFYYFAREWPYKDVQPRIMAEKYMGEEDKGLIDYKFYCFHGEPRFLYVSEGLGGNHRHAKMIFIDLKWNKTPFQRTDFMAFDEIPSKPNGFNAMKELSEKLAEGMPFIRVDWYSVGGKVSFSELTFFPGAGCTPFSPPEWEMEIGNWLHLPI